MTTDEAAHILREMHLKAPTGEKTTHIHLFGIKYAQELKGLRLTDIAERATGRKSHEVEIKTGMNLAKYVQLKNNP